MLTRSRAQAGEQAEEPSLTTPLGDFRTGVSRDFEIDLDRVSPTRMIEYLRARGHLPTPDLSPTRGRPRQRSEIQPQDPPNPTPSNLETLLERLLAQATSQPSPQAPSPTPNPTSTAPTGKLPKFPDPPLYDGEPDRLEGWCIQTRMFLKAYDVDLTTVRSVEMGTMFLRGKAQDWWAAQVKLQETHQTQPIESWDELVRALTAAFRPIELGRRYLNDLLKLSQGKMEMRSYIATFNATRAKLPGALNEESLCHLFLQGCRQDLQRNIAMQKPQTLEDHFSLAVSLADLAGGLGNSKKPEKSGSKETPSSKPTCSHCHKTGHSAEQCWNLHPELKKKKTSTPKKT